MATSPGGLKRFYAVFAVIALVGLGALGYLLAKPATVSIPGQRHDPGVRHGRLSRLCEGLRERSRRDHRIRRLSMSVLRDLCDAPDADHRRAADQDRPPALALPGFSPSTAPLFAPCRPFGRLRRRAGAIWDQHQKIYDGQSEWSEARNAAGIFHDYAKAIGLDLARYDACMSSGKYAGRIQASQEEGVRLGVSSTPTLLVGGGSTRAGSIPTLSPISSIRSRPAPRNELRMGAALLSLLGLFVSAYLYLYKIGRIGTLACGTGECETVQASAVEPVRRRRGGADRHGRVWGDAAREPRVARNRHLPTRRWPATALAVMSGVGVGLYPLPHLPRGVRHPRHLPLVRGFGRDHRSPSSWWPDRSSVALEASDRLVWRLRATSWRRVSAARGRSASSTPAQGRALLVMSVAALGVVYGDIGTSPLYAIKECFTAEYGVPPTPENVLGVLSLVFWSLDFVVIAQVPHLHHAGGQPGRGRHHRPARAPAARSAPSERPRRGS